jgi:hypothetical protein
MYLTSEIAKDTLTARGFRLLAPLVRTARARGAARVPGIIGIR